MGVVDAAHTLCASCAQLKVGGTQEKRDKGYVLEQLSAAKKEGDCSLFFSFNFYIPSSSFFFFRVILYIYSATEEKKKGFFSNNRKDCITQAHRNPIYHITLSLYLLRRYTVYTHFYTRGYIGGDPLQPPIFFFSTPVACLGLKRHVVLSSHTKSVYVSPFLQLEFVLRRVERELKNCLKTFWEAYIQGQQPASAMFFF